jgi:hypothetical protein
MRNVDEAPVVRNVDEAPVKTEKQLEADFDDLTQALDKGETPKMFEEPMTMLTPAKSLDIGIDESLADGSKLKNYSMNEARQLNELLPTAKTGQDQEKLLAPVEEGRKVGARLNLGSTLDAQQNPKLAELMNKGFKLQTIHNKNAKGKALSYAPYVTVENAIFEVSQKGRTEIAAKLKGLDVPEAKNKNPAMSVNGNYTTKRNVLEEMDKDVVEIGFNPVGQHLFIDLTTGQAVKGADIATVIGDRVYAKGVTYFKKSEAPDPLAASDGTDIGSTVRYRRNMGGKLLKALSRGRYSNGKEVRADMRRSDGSVKSAQGFLGPVENTVQGGTMTEVSIGTEINGKKMEIPTMVPTLTEDEVKALSSMKLEGNAKNIPESIIIKAKEHALMRLDQGKSPFYQDGE